jgi:hypothetical protein
MNPYLISLLVYLVLILPLRVSVRVRIGRQMRYLLRVQLIGLPFYKSRRDEDPADEQAIDSHEMTEQLAPDRLRLLRLLMTRPVRSQLRRAIRLEWLSVYAHISQQDAMQNALLYGTLLSVAGALRQIIGQAFPLRIHLKTDFQAQGSELLVRCIASLRLGSLFPAALAWLWQMYRHRQALSKEEEYAASH